MSEHGTADPGVIATTPDEIGGEQAVSFLPNGYQGACRITAGNTVIAVTPDTTQAFRIAGYAITPDGGFTHVCVSACDDAATHLTLEDWICQAGP